jgi:hypothetical protein
MSHYVNNETPYPIRLTNGDEIIFSIGDKRIKYLVKTNHLNIISGGDNDYIFSLLQLKKYEVAGKCYGYHTSEGYWPTSKDEDYEGLTRLVLFLFDKCQEYNGSAKLSHITSDPVKVAKLVKKSIPNEYEEGDTVIFAFGDSEYHYRNSVDYLSYGGGDNDKVFKDMGITLKDIIKWAEKCYGYPPITTGNGWWPTTKDHDQPALNRFIKDIKRVCHVIDEWLDEDYDYTREEVLNLVFNGPFIIQSTNINLNSLQDGRTIKTSAITPTIRVGEKRPGCVIRGKTGRTSTIVGHLSNRKVIG